RRVLLGQKSRQVGRHVVRKSTGAPDFVPLEQRENVSSWVERHRHSPPSTFVAAACGSEGGVGASVTTGTSGAARLAAAFLRFGLTGAKRNKLLRDLV